MFALVSLAAASVVDEHTAFDGVLQFDALQTTVPGLPAVPSVVVATSTITVCLNDCGDATLQANLIAAIKLVSGVPNVAISCGSGCSTRAARSLLQVSGSTGTITITGATLAELNLLQNNIAAGNLLNVGIPTTATVSGATPVTPAQAVINLGGVANLSPANPASPTGTAICSSTNARLVCIARATTALALTNCAVTAAVVNSNGVAAGCCACSVKARRALQQVGTGAQVVAANAATTYAQLCNAAPRGYPGCGKRGSKKGLLGLLGLLGLIPLLLCLLICCLCCLRRKRRGQAMLFSQTAVPAPIPAPLPHVHAEPHLHAGPDFHVHP